MLKQLKGKFGMKCSHDFYKELEHSPSVIVLNKALDNKKLPHAILLHGDDLGALESVCFAISRKLLETTEENLLKHPDFFSIRPVNKMRQINAESTRDLIHQIQHTPNRANRKVAAIYEADRMNITAANAFLKTLEEPPLNTTIFLLTSRPYSLLDTIRSRCFNFRLPAALENIEDAEWTNWEAMYSSWIETVQKRLGSKKEIEKAVIRIYKMVVEFEKILERLGEEDWKKNKEILSEGLAEEEEIAQKTGVVKAIRHRLFKEIELRTRNVALKIPSPAVIDRLTQVVAELERMTGLVEVNLNEATALEAFLLSSLRIWSS